MDPTAYLKGLPPTLRRDLLAAFEQIIKNFRERRWEPSELNGGKLCEVVYTIVKGQIDGAMPNRASKPRDMLTACRELEKAPSTFSRSLRIQIPRLLIALYEVRNNRGVGHAGGEVDPNPMDARLVLEMAKWIMAELVRCFHDVPIEEATQVVEHLVDRTVPIVWDGLGVRRVLDPRLSKKDQTLILLYSKLDGATDIELLAWVEYSTMATFKRDVLRKEHKLRTVEYDEASGQVVLTQRGIQYVEDNLPLTGSL